MGMRQTKLAGLITRFSYEPVVQDPLPLKWFIPLFKMNRMGIIINQGVMLLKLVYMNYRSRWNNNVIIFKKHQF